MRMGIVAVVVTVLGSASQMAAAPLPPALDKFHKEGISILPEKASLIQGEVKSRGSWENHLLQLRKGQTYTFDLATTYPVNLRFVDAESGSVVLNSESGKGEFVAPKKGQYRVLVGSPAGGTGKYTLTMAQKAIPINRDPPGVRSVGKDGLTIASNIMPGDMPDKVRRHLCKTFDVRLDAGKTYQFDLMGSFDTYIRIEDPTGRQIGADDDGGEGLNSRLVLNIPANGIYRVICTSFSGARGEFTLSVRQK